MYTALNENVVSLFQSSERVEASGHPLVKATLLDNLEVDLNVLGLPIPWEIWFIFALVALLYMIAAVLLLMIAWLVISPFVQVFSLISATEAVWTLALSPLLAVTYPYTVYNILVNDKLKHKTKGQKCANLNELYDQASNLELDDFALNLSLKENRSVTPFYYLLALILKQIVPDFGYNNKYWQIGIMATSWLRLFCLWSILPLSLLFYVASIVQVEALVESVAVLTITTGQIDLRAIAKEMYELHDISCLLQDNQAQFCPPGLLFNSTSGECFGCSEWEEPDFTHHECHVKCAQGTRWDAVAHVCTGSCAKYWQAPQTDGNDCVDRCALNELWDGVA